MLWLHMLLPLRMIKTLWSSVYHSCAKLAGIDFDTLIADESQYCVTENFNDSIKLLSARAKMFFTATEKFTASQKGRGLNEWALNIS
jgi:hypothetical protein